METVVGQRDQGLPTAGGNDKCAPEESTGRASEECGKDYVSGQTYASEGFKAGRRRGSRHKHWDQNGARSKSAWARNHKTSRRILFLDKQIRPVLNEGTEYVGGEANRDSTSGCPPEEATNGPRSGRRRECGMEYGGPNTVRAHLWWVGAQITLGPGRRFPWIRGPWDPGDDSRGSG